MLFFNRVRHEFGHGRFGNEMQSPAATTLDLTHRPYHQGSMKGVPHRSGGGNGATVDDILGTRYGRGAIRGKERNQVSHFLRR
jgi:hypothetical protein